MKRYLIKEILSADTYERIALVKRLSDDKEIFVYFVIQKSKGVTQKS